jgi:hypothetical protein
MSLALTCKSLLKCTGGVQFMQGDIRISWATRASFFVEAEKRGVTATWHEIMVGCSVRMCKT